MANDTKKEQKSTVLHRTILAIADELRGAVDGWDFKGYVLGAMFYRYISESLAAFANEREHAAGNAAFDYACMNDADAENKRTELVREKGYFIPPSELFRNVLSNARSDDNLNKTLGRVFSHIEESARGFASESAFAGLFDDFDVDSVMLGATVAKRNDKLAKLLQGIADMNIESVSGDNIEAFGDAYEYLMTLYAAKLGKSGEKFTIPDGVSELLIRLGAIGKKAISKVYDPACGAGNLLITAEKILGRGVVQNGFYGQESNIGTYNLCRINMILHGIGFDKFNIACGDTLTNPQHWKDKPFDLIVSNPPYSQKWEGEDNPLLMADERFAPAGVLAPKNKADMAFIMHALSRLDTHGTAVIVCYPGIMHRGGAEKKIRQYLIDNNFIDCVIKLPINLFYGTSVATCIMVLKKCKTDKNTFFINATNECIQGANNNKLSTENINRIVDVYAGRSEVEYFSYLATYDEIAEKSYNLSVSAYVDVEDTREKINIASINAKLQKIIDREDSLRREISKIIREIEADE